MARKCSVCGKPKVPEFRAFCSAFCRDKDLLAWNNETYVMREDPDLSVDHISSDQKGLDTSKEPF